MQFTICFNRTFMELKYRISNTNNAKRYSFNRTFMELKFIYSRLFCFRPLRVLIVLLWN